MGLNSDLNRIDWEHLLDFTEASTGWEIFKVKFTALCDKHIPKIQIKETFKPPWFDSEVFRPNKKKSTLEKCLSNRIINSTIKNFPQKSLKISLRSKCGQTSMIMRFQILLRKMFGHLLNLVQNS